MQTPGVDWRKPDQMTAQSHEYGPSTAQSTGKSPAREADARRSANNAGRRRGGVMEIVWSRGPSAGGGPAESRGSPVGVTGRTPQSHTVVLHQELFPVHCSLPRNAWKVQVHSNREIIYL